MTMIITVKDDFANQVKELLKTLPDDVLTIEETPRAWYADEVSRRIGEYKSGKMETAPLDQDFWDEMDEYIDTVA